MAALGDVPGIAITLVIIAAVFVAGFLVVEGLRGGLTPGSAADNASADIETGMTNVTSYAPTWGTLIGVTVLLGIVLAAFYFGRKYSGGTGGM